MWDLFQNISKETICIPLILHPVKEGGHPLSSKNLKYLNDSKKCWILI
jgi:hypothetical protein